MAEVLPQGQTFLSQVPVLNLNGKVGMALITELLLLQPHISVTLEHSVVFLV